MSISGPSKRNRKSFYLSIYTYFLFLEMTYVPQENIEVIKNTKILHPSVEDYFENFDGSQYLPRPWLKTVYPRD